MFAAAGCPSIRTVSESSTRRAVARSLSAVKRRELRAAHRAANTTSSDSGAPAARRGELNAQPYSEARNTRGSGRLRPAGRRAAVTDASGQLPLRDRYLPDLASVLRRRRPDVRRRPAGADRHRPAGQPHPPPAGLPAPRAGALPAGCSTQPAGSPSSPSPSTARWSTTPKTRRSTSRSNGRWRRSCSAARTSTLCSATSAAPTPCTAAGSPRRCAGSWTHLDDGAWRAECTGFGFNLLTGNYEFASLIVVHDEAWWEKFGGQHRGQLGIRRPAPLLDPRPRCCLQRSSSTPPGATKDSSHSSRDYAASPRSVTAAPTYPPSNGRPDRGRQLAPRQRRHRRRPIPRLAPRPLHRPDAAASATPTPSKSNGASTPPAKTPQRLDHRRRPHHPAHADHRPLRTSNSPSAPSP